MCLQDFAECHYDGSLGYCCSGFCEQYAGQPRGHCKQSERTTIQSVETNSSTTPFPNCLPENSPCLPDGSLGTCCSVNCEKLLEEKIGKCKGSSVPTKIPEKCLDNGATCKSDGSLGFCCSRYCDVIFPHEVGHCKETISPLAEEHTNSPWIIYTSISIISVITMVIVATLVVLYIRQRKLEKGLTNKEAQHFFKGNPRKLNNAYSYAHEGVDNIPYNKELEINEKDFSLDWENRLGQGNFGVVVMGHLHGETNVAVKALNDNENTDKHMYLRALLSEIKILQYVGKHNHIVNMLGCHTAKIHDAQVFLFLEYCPLGCLETFLRSNKSTYPTNNNANSKSYVQASDIARAYGNENDIITHNDLITWSLQITEAMIFLCEKKVIHVDLATRNVLLLRKDCAKVTDFGLSRKLYQYRNYVKKTKEPLPWNWMALESLRNFEFSHKSDVWSLGMTFWEIHSFGEVPYSCLSWNEDFLMKVENGLRPPKPSAASDKMYQIMLDCWNVTPNLRPDFSDVFQRLEEFLVIGNLI